MNLTRMLKHLPFEEIVSANGGITQTPRPWGFTIYRTAYGDLNDQLWLILVETIKTHVRVELLSRGDPHKGHSESEVHAAQKLLSLFRLDERSDRDLLDGKSLDEVRDIFKGDEVPGGEPMNYVRGSSRVFLVADKETLRLVDEGFNAVKCVAADYESPRQPQRMQQFYFGWMKMTTRSVLWLWDSLDTFPSLEEIAPGTLNEADMKTWNGDGAY